MNKKYYEVTEALKILQKTDVDFTLRMIATYAQEKIIRPLIYINSLAAHACEIEQTPSGDMLFVCGYCYLTAYWDVIGNEIIGVLNRLLLEPKLKIDSAIYKIQFISEPKISSWQINHQFFNKVPSERHRLKKSKEEAIIYAQPNINPQEETTLECNYSYGQGDNIAIYTLVKKFTGIGWVYSGFGNSTAICQSITDPATCAAE